MNPHTKLGLVRQRFHCSCVTKRPLPVSAADLMPCFSVSVFRSGIFRRSGVSEEAWREKRWG